MKEVRSLIFSKVIRSRISHENTPKHPPSPRSEHLILHGSVCDSGLPDGCIQLIKTRIRNERNKLVYNTWFFILPNK